MENVPKVNEFSKIKKEAIFYGFSSNEHKRDNNKKENKKVHKNENKNENNNYNNNDDKTISTDGKKDN